jgi:hypothetical protein
MSSSLRNGVKGWAGTAPVWIPLAVGLALAGWGCRSGADRIAEVKPGMAMEEVKALIGEPKRASLGREEMVFSGPDSVGDVAFVRVDSSDVVTWEYYIVRYASLSCKGPTFIVDPINNTESRQPSSTLRILQEFEVLFNRSSGVVTEAGFRPAGFIDLTTGKPAIRARVE